MTELFLLYLAGTYQIDAWVVYKNDIRKSQPPLQILRCNNKEVSKHFLGNF